MTKEEAFERYLEANAKEKEAWQAYLNACAVTRRASAEHDRVAFAELLRPRLPTPRKGETDVRDNANPQT
jgi:hypothetical protein